MSLSKLWILKKISSISKYNIIPAFCFYSIVIFSKEISIPYIYISRSEENKFVHEIIASNELYFISNIEI